MIVSDVLFSGANGFNSELGERAEDFCDKVLRRTTRKQYSAEEKIRIVLDRLRGAHSIAELCRRESIPANQAGILLGDETTVAKIRAILFANKKFK